MGKKRRLCPALFLLAALGLGACSRTGYVFHFQPAPLAQVEAATPPATEGQPAPTEAAANIPALARPALRRRQRQNSAGPPARHPAVARQFSARLQAFASASRSERPAGPVRDEPPRQRSRGVALLLALLFGGLGLHLFYLGYYGRGTLYLVLTLVGVLLFSLAAIALVVAVVGGSTSGLLGLLVAGALLTGAAGVLALIDAVQILTGDLKPKNGEYRSRFF